jgi:ABC-type multidrug transport system fused ATPase/permease subunit
MCEVFRVTVTGRDLPDAGELNNLLATDVQKIYECVQQINFVWVAPVMIVVVSAILVALLGPVALFGVLVLASAFPISTILLKLMRRVRAKRMPFMDARIKACTETLQGIRFVKLAAWEALLAKRILGIRAAEMEHLRSELTLWVLTMVSIVTCPVFAMISCFAALTLLQGRVLTAADTFAALSLFNALKFPLNFGGQCLSLIAQALGSLDRIALFLAAGNTTNTTTTTTTAATASTTNKTTGSPRVEISSNDSDDSLKPTNPPDPTLQADTLTSTAQSQPELLMSLTNASFVRTHHTEQKGEEVRTFTLGPLDLQLRRGELLTVIGPVGSGKSTLVEGLLGDVPCTPASHVSVASAGGIGYASQTPFILNDTVRNNILFGLPFEETRYRAALSACCLLPDLLLLPEGERTMIGEKGVTLSGQNCPRNSESPHNLDNLRILTDSDDSYNTDKPLNYPDNQNERFIILIPLKRWAKAKDLSCTGRICGTFGVHFR